MANQPLAVLSAAGVTKGELHIQLLYYPAQEGEGDCQPELMEYSLPVSQIIDSANADDECVCNVQYQVTSCEVQPKPDMDGDNRILAITAEIAARANIHRREQMVLSECGSGYPFLQGNHTAAGEYSGRNLRLEQGDRPKCKSGPRANCTDIPAGKHPFGAG